MTAPDPTILAAAIKCAEEDLHLQRDIDDPEVNKVRALVAAAKAYQPWQPIETAPRDGTAFMAYVPTLVGYAARQDIAIIHWSGWGGGVWETSEGHKLGVSSEPTHWQPLPAPPAALNPAADAAVRGMKEANDLPKVVGLVPKGWNWSVEHFEFDATLPYREPGAKASVWRDSRNPKERVFNVEGKTPALALRAAIEKATKP